MIIAAVLLGLGFLGGVAGALLLGRFFRGLTAIGLIALWTLAPFAMLAFVLMSSVRPDWTEQQVNFNYAAGYIVGGLGIALVWLPGVVIGALVGRSMRPRPQPVAEPGEA